METSKEQYIQNAAQLVTIFQAQGTMANLAIIVRSSYNSHI